MKQEPFQCGNLYLCVQHRLFIVLSSLRVVVVITTIVCPPSKPLNGEVGVESSPGLKESTNDKQLCL